VITEQLAECQAVSVPTLFKPFVEIRVYSSAGQPPDSGWMCDDELLRGEATRGL
jgi:hypothetical protein